MGEWDAPAIDATTRITFRSDHTSVVSTTGLGDHTFTGTARWRVDGDYLVVTTDDHHVERRAKIVQVAAEKLRLREPDGKILTYTRVK